jgi:hypothetical protein
MTKRVVLSGNSPGLASVDATLADLCSDASGDSTKALYGDGNFRNPSGGGIQSTTVSLTSVQLLGLGTSPVLILAAPGAGKVTVVLNTIYEYTFGSVAYTYAGGGGGLFYGSSIEGATADNGDSSLLNGTVNQIIITAGGDTSNVNATSAVANQPLYYATNGNPTLGNGTLKITVYYLTFTL